MTRHDAPWPAGAPCWVDLAAPDLDAARRLYGAAMGWDFAESGDEYGGYVVATRSGAAAAGLGPLQPGTDPAWTLYFATDDVDTTAARAADSGGTVLAEPFDVSGQGRMAILMDPGGAPFGLWQAGGHNGCGIVNEPGGLAWEDGRSGDPDAARTFYAAVFGYLWSPRGEREPGYHVFALPDRPEYPIGGLGPVPEDQPPHWLPCFAVDDTDAVIAAVTQAGGGVYDGPDDTPFGRAASLRDPAGARFSVMQSPAGGWQQP